MSVVKLIAAQSMALGGGGDSGLVVQPANTAQEVVHLGCRRST